MMSLAEYAEASSENRVRTDQEDFSQSSQRRFSKRLAEKVKVRHEARGACSGNVRKNREISRKVRRDRKYKNISRRARKIKKISRGSAENAEHPPLYSPFVPKGDGRRPGG
jgi:hypothetical protein